MNETQNDAQPAAPLPASPAAEPRKPPRAFRRSPLSGKPPVFATKKIEDSFFAALSLGISIESACEIVGCTRQTIYNERDRNPEFAARLVNVKDSIKLDYWLKLRDAAVRAGAAKERPDWRGFAWMLERRFPNDFGKRDPDAVTPEQFMAERARMAALIAEFIPADKLTDFHARVNGLAGVGVGEAAIEAAVNPPKPAAGVNEATEASGDALET